MTGLLIVAVRALLGLVLLAAGLAKLLQGRHRFAKIVADYELLPRPIVMLAARVIPWLELVMGAALVTGALGPAAAACATVVLLVFAAAVTISLLRGRRDIECGCFGVAPRQRLTWWLVPRNLGLAGLAGWLAVESALSATPRLLDSDSIAGFLLGTGIFGLWLAAGVLRALWAASALPAAVTAGRQGHHHGHRRISLISVSTRSRRPGAEEGSHNP